MNKCENCSTKGQKNIRKPSFLKRCFLWFFHNSHIVLFVAIVAFGRKQFIMWPLPWNVLLLQTLNNDETVLFISTYKKIKKHSWHYRIRKVLKRASGNSLKESYYCTHFYMCCCWCIRTLSEILFSGFLFRVNLKLFCWKFRVAAEVVQISNGFFCIIFSCGTGIR